MNLESWKKNQKLDRIQYLPWSSDLSWPAGSSALTGGLSDCCSHDNISWTRDMMSELSWSCPSSSGHPLMEEDKKMSVTRCRSFNLLAIILLLFSSAGKASKWGSDFMSSLCIYDFMYCFSLQNDWHSSREWTKMSVYNECILDSTQTNLYSNSCKCTFLLTVQLFLC